MVVIKRVVSSFILTKDLRVAVFLRRPTLPTFASHWAACSGSIEANETPWQAAKRELYEETNLGESIDSIVEPEHHHGLFVDVPLEKRTRPQQRLHDEEQSESTSTDTTTTIIFRVYPFVVHMPDNTSLELRGTEHETFQFVSIPEILALQPSVPMLAQAFHHATMGQYLTTIPDIVRQWASNRQDGAMTMAQQAMRLLKDHPEVDPLQMKLLRPTMVAITNALNMYMETRDPELVLERMNEETQRSIRLAIDSILSIVKEWRRQQQATTATTCPSDTFRIATFSRSSTLVNVLNMVREEVSKLGHGITFSCSQSSPGDEGELMAQDLRQSSSSSSSGLHVGVLSDDELIESIQYHLVLIGCDCIT